MRPLSSFWSALERPVSWLQSSCFVSGSSIFVTRRTKRCIYAVSDATLLLPLLIPLLLPLLPPHRRRIRKPERLCRLLGSGCSYTCLVWLGSLIVGFPRRVFGIDIRLLCLIGGFDGFFLSVYPDAPGGFGLLFWSPTSFTVAVECTLQRGT